jgi:hypothetical protein
MNTKLRLLAGIFLLFSVAVFLPACSKDDNQDEKMTGKVTFRMTDGPGDYDAVLLDIQQVEVNVDGQWTTMAVLNPGIYNILEFKNGMDTLLGTTFLPVGKISQIRLILGANNSVVIDGNSYALQTPSAQESGAKLNLHTTLEANASYNFWIDFDAAKSIVKTGSDKYILKPVIRAYSDLTNGKIEGFVLPLSANAVVYATSGTDIFSAIPNADGRFVISGLPEGTYSLTIDADDSTGYIDITLPNVSVSFGVITQVPTITLQL